MLRVNGRMDPSSAGPANAHGLPQRREHLTFGIRTSTSALRLGSTLPAIVP